jgi:hypothetical protein
MKKDRLLEIIREEISAALTEIEKGEIELPKGTPSSSAKQYIDKGFDVKFVDPLTGKMVQKESESEGDIEEEQLDEMAKITEPIRKGIEVAVDRMIKQKSDITPEEITKLLRNKKSQEQVAPELKAALDADEAEKGGDAKYTFGIGYPQTLGAVQIAMGLKKAKGSEPAAEKGPKAAAAPKVKAAMAPKAEPMDDEDAAAMKSAGSDETAKKLASTPEDKKETFNRILGLVTKYKDDKAKIDAFITKAEKDYKLPASLVKDLKRAAGRDVEV